MELVIVGLPGSGKTAVGRRLATRHGAEFVDLDERVERDASMRVPEIFETEGVQETLAADKEAFGGPNPALWTPPVYVY